MAHDGHSHDHDSDHKHDHTHGQGEGACCGSGQGAMCGDIGPVGDVTAKGRSFRVNGLDCAEEVAILNKVLGPVVGGTEHLAFDVINGRMTVLDSGKALADDRIIKLVGSTGMSAKPWDADSAAADQAAHLKWQRFFTAVSGVFWASSFSSCSTISSVSVIRESCCLSRDGSASSLACVMSAFASS